MTASIPGDTRDDDADRAPSTEPARGSKDLEKSDSPDPFADLFSDSLSSDEHVAKPSKSKKHKTKKEKKDQKVKKKKKKEKKNKK